MSTSTTLNCGGTTTPAPSLPTSSHVSSGLMHSSTPVHAFGPNPVNPQPPPPLVPATAFEKAIQKYVEELSDGDKAAFRDAPDVIVRLQEMQDNDKPLISNRSTARVEKVLQCVKHFMDSLAIFIQQSPETSSLVVGGVKCVLTVSVFYCLCKYNKLLIMSSLLWDTLSSLSVLPK